jgi:hypothetical protein
MGFFGLGLTGGLMIAVACLMPPAQAQEKSAPPDFSFHHGVGWASAEGNGPNFSAVLAIDVMYSGERPTIPSTAA